MYNLFAMTFIPLHINSTYSFLQSALTLDKLINNTIKNKYPAVALTDNNSLIGSVKFFNKCNANNIKPIIGLDLKIENYLFTFLVKNEIGYSNLLYLSKLYNENKLSFDKVKGHTEGLITIFSSKINNLLSKYLELDEIKFAYYLKDISDIFSEFFIGLEIYSQDIKEGYKKLRDYLSKRNYQLVAFPFIRYESKQDEIVYKIVTAIKNDSHLSENEKEADGINYFYSQEEINSLYELEDISNTEKIANEIDFNLIKKRGKLLSYSNNVDEELSTLANKLLKEKVEVTSIYQDRLNKELEVIKRMGYSSYFLIVADYVKFAKDHGIYVGAGRGSSGGSLVAFALNIITVDPIKANLLFERFLNEGRNTMPDIDVDFEDVRREEIVEYIRNKYGSNKVGNIITSQTLKAKAAIRDIGRVYKIKDSYIDILCKATGGYDDLHDAYRYSKTFKNIVDSDKYYLFIVKMASKIEGFPRQAGMHAAGIIINADPLDISLPVYKNDDIYTSQLEKDDLETLGFLKMDVLGLRNLTVVKDVIEKVNDPKLTYESLPYEDSDSIKLIATGHTVGLFQLESKGMIQTIKELKPSTFEDIVALLSLFRPGPMKFIPSYIKRKYGRERIIYPTPKLEPILKSTFGIIVYQEQIMQIAQVMAGFSLSEADSFRRAISKKDANKIASLKTAFITRSIKNGNNQKVSEDIFSMIERFASYGFNRSHAYVYAKLASQMAYLKLHHPTYFYCSILDNGGKFNDIVAELRTRKIKLRLPNINIATNRYKAINDLIYFPISAIKGINSMSVNNLIKERDEKGEYKSFIDFVIRNNKYRISPTTLIKLIDAGCFDSFNNTRNGLKASISKIMDYIKLVYNSNNQMILDDSIVPPPSILDIEDDSQEKVNKELEALGIALSKSPLDFYKDVIEKEQATSIDEGIKNKFCKVAGVIKSVRRIKTKGNHKDMCFITISDNITDISVTVFSDLYSKHESSLINAKILIVKGRYEKNRNEIVADELKLL